MPGKWVNDPIPRGGGPPVLFFYGYNDPISVAIADPTDETEDHSKSSPLPP
jgi:hypothetical protein